MHKNVLVNEAGVRRASEPGESPAQSPWQGRRGCMQAAERGCVRLEHRSSSGVGDGLESPQRPGLLSHIKDSSHHPKSNGKPCVSPKQKGDRQVGLLVGRLTVGDEQTEREQADRFG